MNNNTFTESYAKIDVVRAEKSVSEEIVRGNNFLKYLIADSKLDKLRNTIVNKLKNKKINKNIYKKYFHKNTVACDSDLINVFMYLQGVRKCLQIDPKQTLREICVAYDIDVLSMWFVLNTKPLNVDLSLSEYNIHEGASIICNYAMVGGNKVLLPTYSHVSECEKQVLFSHWSLQNDEISENCFITDSLNSVRGLVDVLPNDSKWIVDTFENFFQIAYWLRKCDNKQDYMVCTGLAFKLLTGKGICSSLWKIFQINNLQDDSFTTSLRKLRDLFNTTNTVINDPILNKIKQIYTYLLVQGFLSKSGESLSPEEFKLYDIKFRDTRNNKGGFILLVVETALAICERYDAYRVTGDWYALIHDDASYVKWAQEADRLIGLGPFTSNLEAHGTTYFSFVSDLNDTIEKGAAIVKYSKSNLGVTSNFMSKKLQSLQLLKNVEITRRASQKERKAPFGVLIHGGSSVAKSTFTKMLFYYYGKLHNLDTDDHYRYVRNPTDEYWSNFDSSKWCIQMDDIAFLLASKCSDTDPTLKEMLNVVNNVPYVPPQAALEDKGKTPVMAKLVLATTNTPDLNAQEYFACPLAVRRRLPYIIQVVPKKEYLHANRKFIDPTKLDLKPGEFPDFWNISIQRLDHVDYHGRDSAKLTTIEKFDNIHEFLKHFAEASLKHEEIQTKSDGCDTQMRDISVCRLCYSVGDNCECMQSEILTRTMIGYLCGYFVELVIRFILYASFTWVMVWSYKFKISRHVLARLTNFLNREYQLKFLGRMNQQNNFTLKVSIKQILGVGLAVIQIIAAWKLSNAVCARVIKKKVVLDPKDEETETPQMHLQGNFLNTTEEQLQKEESRNVWYNPTLELNKFDVPLPSQSLGNMTPSGVRDLFSNNCVRVEITALDATYMSRTGAIFLKGQFLCVNNHAFRMGTRFKIHIIDTCVSQGLSSNLDVYVSKSEMRVNTNRDLAVFKVKNAPPRKDITKYWNTVNIPVTHIVSVSRDISGFVSYVELFNVNYCENFPVETLGVTMPVFIGTGNATTKQGDCGALGVGLTPRGPIILGIHTLGHNQTAGFPHCTLSEIQEMCTEDELTVEGGGTPLLSLNGDVTLVKPHFKSLFRYIPEGSLNIYGSFPGFRPKPKSKVCATPLSSEMAEHFECNIDYGKPDMSGWEPWFLNIKEMVVPHTNIDQECLNSCVRSFANDIIADLHKKYGNNWMGDLVTLSDRAAVNGLPGVKYIDRINVNSSMGHPWNTGKKRFLIESRDEIYPEGVNFPENIWDRVRQIEDKYSRGCRAYPVFTAHLKDEAIHKDKIAKKKVRMFTGAPIDISLVIRKKLLSFVRLLQKNKLTFEAAPGAVAQSSEWGDFYNYLTRFGKDRMVAGDYGKFDKHMIASFVLAAFEVIVEIHREAGFNDIELREIMCIGYDMSFPLVNVSGDLVEFFGTNPSGHPLTVVVNSIVNSLYMRYAYTKLNPNKECHTFKENVNLLTYGDDNIMGVSRKTNWFNHSAIQDVLQTIGVEYTMADKESVSVPFINIDTCSFLKRSWRYEDDVGNYVCPLDITSIHKSLTVWVPSGTIDQYAQMVAVITSANNEFFFHGREIFEKHRNFFKNILEQHPYNIYVEESTLPTWDDLCNRFMEASKGI